MGVALRWTTVTPECVGCCATTATPASGTLQMIRTG